MGEETEQNLLEKFLTENKRLKQRIFELEQRLLQAESKTEEHTKSQTQVLKLLQQKDKTIDEATSKLYEELKLYKEILQSDSSAVIVLNKVSQVSFFNRTASTIVGSTLQLANDLSDIDFASVDLQIPKFLQNVILSKKRETIKNKVSDKIVYTSGIPISIDGEHWGFLIKITLAKAQ